MKNSTITAAVAALFMAAAPLAWAQASSASVQDSNVGMTNPTGTAIQSNQFRASKMIGSDVYDTQNQNIGSVKDLIIDKDGRVAAAVVAVGGGFLDSNGKNVAVPLADIKSDNNRLTLNMTKNQIKEAQNYDMTNSNTGAGTTTSPVTGGHLGAASGTNR
ncbi:MAG: PRC-barrel domain-containing protein [Stellaceae bacterium]